MTRSIIRNAALIVVFGVVGMMLFTENVRTVQIVGLFACGMAVGASLTGIVASIRAKQ